MTRMIQIIFKTSLVLALLVIFNNQVQNVSADEASLAILFHPEYFVYTTSADQEHLKLSEFKQLLLTSNQYSIEKPVSWKGLTNKNSLLSPKVTLLFLADNKVADINAVSTNQKLVKIYPIDQDDNANFGYLKDSTSQADNQFNELPTDAELQSKLQRDCTKDSFIYVFKISKPITNLAERLESVFTTISTKCPTIKDANKDLLVYFLSVNLADVPRLKRQAVTQSSAKNVTNPAEFYRDQYPAMFNIIFWTSLILALTVISIAYGMSYMDPGLNTVIYRMTSQRIKKDQ